jgi:hypothetical protein
MRSSCMCPCIAPPSVDGAEDGACVVLATAAAPLRSTPPLGVRVHGDTDGCGWPTLVQESVASARVHAVDTAVSAGVVAEVLQKSNAAARSRLWRELRRGVNNTTDAQPGPCRSVAFLRVRLRGGNMSMRDAEELLLAEEEDEECLT